jgi:hypothetical protein
MIAEKHCPALILRSVLEWGPLVYSLTVRRESRM